MLDTIYEIDETDRRLIAATQDGLPLVRQPYHALAEQLGLDAEDVKGRMKRMLAAGVIRRIGIIPNHYKLGVTANGMSVWDVDDRFVAEAGREVGQLSFVSHCYRRPRHLPDWPFNLFAMVHGRSRDETERQVAVIADLLGQRARAHDVLYSTRILKKSGLRLSK